jgi:indole-3-glycerol phosphate synthase
MVSAGAVSLSVLTQPYLFDGSIDYLAMIRKTINIPLLMKDIIVSEVQIDCAKRIGADCILLIKTMFDNNLAEGSLEKFSEYATKKGLKVLVEVHSEQEFEEVVRYRRKYYDLIGVNNRDLNNLDVDISTTARLLKQVNKGNNIVVSESGITKAGEIRYLKEAGADCFLIGTSILASANIESKLKELYFSL